MDLFNTEVLDIFIEDARSKKKTVESKMDLIIGLMREVEWREKAAEKAKQEVDNCTLYINLEMDELILAQQHAKESNDKHAKEVYAQRAELVTAMKVLQFRISGVLHEGDGCVAAIDEMRKALEKRLTSAVIKKEAADKDKLGKELALAYQKSQMENLIEESKKLEEEAMENLKLQEFLIDRGHVLNMLQEEISCKCQDVNLLKLELEDYQAENKIVKSRKNDSELIQGLADSYMDLLDKGKWTIFGPNLKHAYLESQMEKLVEESKITEQQAMENLKLQEYLLIMKEMSEDSQDESETWVTEDYLRPIIQETLPLQDCECYKCCDIWEEVYDRSVPGGEMRTSKIMKSQIKDSEIIQESADSHTDQLDKVKRNRIESKRPEHEAMESLKLQEFLPMKEMLEDSQYKSEILVTKDYLRPIVQETTPTQDCESYNCDSSLEGVKGRVVDSREELRTNKNNVKSKTNDSEEIHELANSYMDLLEKGKRARNRKAAAKRRQEHTRRACPGYRLPITRR